MPTTKSDPRSRPSAWLTPDAKSVLRAYGVTQAAWLRCFPGADRCGCSDDRCIGFHHHETETDCHCLRALLESDFYRSSGYLSPEVCAQLDASAARWS